MRKTKLKNVKDNKTFKRETRSRAATWTVQTKRKGMVTATSAGGSTRVIAGSTEVYVEK